MPKVKVIHVLNHSLSKVIPEPEKFLLETWPGRVAKYVLRNTKEFDIECWFPEETLQHEKSKTISGIKFRMFPSKSITAGREVSKHIVWHLKEEAKRGKIIVHLHGYHYYLPYMIAYSLRGVPIIAQHHGDEEPMSKSGRKIIKPILAVERILEKRCLRNVSKFFVLTEKERDYLSGFIDKKRIEFLTMGADFGVYKPRNKISARSKLKLPRKAKIMCFVGNVSERKGVHLLLSIMPSLLRVIPNLFFVIVGEAHGKYKLDLENMIVDNGLQANVLMVYRISDKWLPYFYNAADVFVLPSMQEGAPVTIMESFASDTPVIATHVGDVPNMVKNMKTGIVVPPRDKSAFGNAVIRFFSNRSKFGGCRSSNWKYDWNRIAKRTVEVYRELSK